MAGRSESVILARRGNDASGFWMGWVAGGETKIANSAGCID